MNLPVRVSEEAAAETAEAARWYERQRRGLGVAFLEAVDAAVARIEDNPGIGSPTPAVLDEGIRRVFVHRFPYHVVYVRLAGRLQVLAVAHDRRRPGYWATRLPR